MSKPEDYEREKIRIANIINVARDIEFGTAGNTRLNYWASIDKYNPNLIGKLNELEELERNLDLELYGVMGRPGRGVEQLPVFTLNDVDRLIFEIMERSGAEASFFRDFEDKLKFAEALFQDLEINLDTGRVDKKAYRGWGVSDAEGKERIFVSTRANRELEQMQNQVFNDASILLNGNLLASTLSPSAELGLIGDSPEQGRRIKRHIINRDDTPATEDMDETASVRWLDTFFTNTSRIRSFLLDGIIRNEDGSPVDIDTVTGWDPMDVKDSLAALIRYELKNPTRIIDGQSLIPQWNNTFTDRREREVIEKIGTWGWNGDDSITANVKRILSNDQVRRSADDQTVYTDSDQRYSARDTRDKIIGNLEDMMRFSLYDEGSSQYAEEAVGNMIDLVGSDFMNYDQRYADTLSIMSSSKFKPGTTDGNDAAADSVLNMLKIRKDEISEEAYRNLSDLMELYARLGDVLDDPAIGEQLEVAKQQKANEEAAKEREKAAGDTAAEATALAKLNSAASVGSLVKNALRIQGVLGVGTSKEFEKHLDSVTVPDIIRRIANAGGIANSEDVTDFVQRFTERSKLGKEGELAAYDVIETDFRRQMMADPSRPPVFGGMEFKVDQAYTPEPIPEARFDIASLQPELQTLAFERPEFAKFLSIQMSDPEYLKAFKKVGQERLKVTEEGDVLAAETAAEFGKRAAYAREEARQAQASLEGYQRERTEEEEAARVEEERRKRVEEERRKQAAYVSPEEEEAGMVTPAVTPTEEIPYDYAATFPVDPDKLEAAYRQDYEEAQARADEAAKYTGAAFTKHLYKFQRTPGMTTEEFFRSRLPGFETQFKGTAFEKAALERKRLEEEAETSRRRQEIARTSARTIVRSRQ